jgi:MHS family citrate/tricarballylate:H+ symporter-like MFS transporter
MAIADHQISNTPSATLRPALPPTRHVAAVCVGNALEFYDFVTYAFFAAQIGRSFFPSHTHGASLLASLATFGAGFLTRPLGALVIGRMGDRVGRKPAMLLSFVLIGIATIGLPLTPSYASIGVLAPVLVVGFRLLQGFALGGEVGPSTAFMMEAAPPLRRGLYISLQSMSADAAVLVAGLVGYGLANVLDPAALDQWGWRVALLLGGMIVPFGLILRRNLGETLEADHKTSPIQSPIHGRSYRQIIGLSLAMLAAATTTNYILDYMTTYAGSTLGMPAGLALGATVVVGLCGVVCDPISGWLSDRYGRKPVMIAPWIVLLLAIFPCFWLLAKWRTGAALYGASAVLAVASTLSSASVLVTITESLPHRVRAGSLSLIYALAISIFGGSTQFMVNWLTGISGSALAPAWYMVGGVLVGLSAILMMPETAPIKTQRTAHDATFDNGWKAISERDDQPGH